MRADHVVTGADASGRSVSMQTLDRALFDSGRIPILIKIDVEGQECRVLDGAAAILGRCRPVLVLEQHYVPGGFTHMFKRPGYEWDVGVHYVGEMGEAYPIPVGTTDWP